MGGGYLFCQSCSGLALGPSCMEWPACMGEMAHHMRSISPGDLNLGGRAWMGKMAYHMRSMSPGDLNLGGEYESTLLYH